MFVALFVYLGAQQGGARPLPHERISRARCHDHRSPHPVARKLDPRRGDLLLSTSQQDFPVMHGDEVMGLLTRPGADARHAAGGAGCLRGGGHGP